MALSESELDLAKTVAGRIRFYETWRKWRPFGLGFCAFILVLSAVEFWSIFFERAAHFETPLIFLMYAGAGFNRFRQAKRLYPNDIRLLEGFRQKAGGEFPPDFNVPVDHSLLKSWNRRLDKRPIPWRVDRFLSRGRSIN